MTKKLTKEQEESLKCLERLFSILNTEQEEDGDIFIQKDGELYEKPKCGKDDKTMWCYCGKCEPERYPLPKDFPNPQPKEIKKIIISPIIRETDNSNLRGEIMLADKINELIDAVNKLNKK